MKVYDMPGGHLDMMEEPLVGTTADLVRQQLRPALTGKACRETCRGTARDRFS